MLVSWSVMWIVGLICYSDCTCSQTSFYKSCWIRRYPGVYVDVEESQRRGAHVLNIYHEDTASKCSRSCCTTSNCEFTLQHSHKNSLNQNTFTLLKMAQTHLKNTFRIFFYKWIDAVWNKTHFWHFLVV